MMLHVLDRLAASVLPFDGADFSSPPGEPAMTSPGSVSWRVFANPVSLYIGGIAAVLLELGEPRVRHGVWDHTSFRTDPGRRMRRTGLAAMVTVYGARSSFAALARRVNAMHAQVRGETPGGTAYEANEPELLRFVQLTASWGFMEAYHRHVRSLGAAERDAFYSEAQAGAALYGVTDPPGSDGEAQAMLRAMLPMLGPSEILSELLHILRTAPILPAPLRWFQRLGVTAAIDLLPTPFRMRLGLGREPLLGPAERMLLRSVAAAAERVQLPSSPAILAAKRVSARQPELQRGSTANA